MTDKPAPVEQADRDAAADLYLEQHQPAWEHDYAKAAAIRKGSFNDYVVQAFARHRQPLAARVAELEAENALFKNALIEIRGYSEPNGMTRRKLKAIATDALARALLGDKS